MTPQELKNSILQLAIQGKLVEQRPEEGTAEELYKKIQTEKQKLIKAGKIKKEKPLPEITEDEIPFEIPKSWSWIRLGECCEMYTGNSISEHEKKTKYEGRKEGFDYIGTKDVTFEQTIDYNNGVKIPFENDFRRAYKSTILLCIEGGSAGRKIAILDREVCFGNKLCMFNPVKLSHKFLFYYLQSSEFKSIFAGNTTGIIGGVSIGKLKCLLLPLPPLAEQKRIVAKIEELLPLAVRYGEAWDRLEELNKRFPDDMRKSVLQLAIQGKLVEQRPEEGTAEELYKKIQAEKQKLIKAGKIRKEKPLPEITEDEIPFEIPESWKWVRLNDICNISDGTHQTPHYVEQGIPFISAQNVKPYRFIPEIHRKVSESDFLEYNKIVAPAKGDILMTRVGAGIGEAAIIDRDFKFSIYVSLTLIKQYGRQLNMEYLLHVLNSPQGKRLAEKKTLGKGASQGNLNLIFIREFALPLPPFAEQKRIVAKIEEFLPLCERLK